MNRQYSWQNNPCNYLLKYVKPDDIMAMFQGDYSEVEPPVLIPNTEVKRLCADDTTLATVWESMTLPRNKKTPEHKGVFFISLILEIAKMT